MEELRIIDTNCENIREFGVCGYKSPKTPGFTEKTGWLEARYDEGLRLKTLLSEKDGNQGMIEYIPGEYCWRPVEAGGFMFIHCLFTGFKNEYKGKGYGSLLIEECLRESRENGMKGVAFVTRKGSFMAGNGIFLKHGFEVVDRVKPDFELLALRFDSSSASPRFAPGLEQRPAIYSDGLYIFRGDQCPYTVKNVREIVDVAGDIFGLKTTVIELRSAAEAQANPCPFGTFGIILNGRIIAHHPISKTRFMNIMNSKLK